MSDRELLELAAKAAGIDYKPDNKDWKHDDHCAFWDYDDLCTCGARWNPLDDDGDALRLAVTLRMDVDIYYGEVVSGEEGERNQFLIDDKGAHDAATRRAIVRAAAEVGAGLRPFPTAEEIREDWT